MEPCQNTEKLDAGASDDKAKEIEHDTAAQSIKCCDRPSQEKSSCVPTADVEQGFERPPDPGRRETFAQKVRNRFRSEHDVMRDVPPLKEQTCESKSPECGCMKSHLTKGAVDDLPWGYPRLAGFVNIDTNTHLYRRFGYLRNRTLLYVQDELVHLERKLEAMDAADAADEPYRLASRSWDEENDPKRKILMGEIKAKLKEYDDLLIREETILKMEAPSQKLHQHYRNYMWFEKPLCPEDAEFVYHKDDMVNLHGYTESNWIKPMVDSLMMALPPSVMKVSIGVVETGNHLRLHGLVHHNYTVSDKGKAA
ncbi:MAG: hypothetical protein LQ340_005936 [Diploschistes diacapsis]|nr:MAG: hypothetical protein LQ340_005936 [Diploschistes diacapsis]